MDSRLLPPLPPPPPRPRRRHRRLLPRPRRLPPRIGDYNCPELYSLIMRDTSTQVKLQSLTADSFISLS